MEAASCAGRKRLVSKKKSKRRVSSGKAEDKAVFAYFTTSEGTPFLFDSSALIPHGVRTPCLGTISTPGTRTQQDARARVQSTTDKHQSLLEFLILAFYGFAEPRVGKVHFAHLLLRSPDETDVAQSQLTLRTFPMPVWSLS